MRNINRIALVLLLVMLLPQAAMAADFCNVLPAGGNTGVAIRVPCLLQGVAGPAGATTVGGFILIVLQIMLLVIGSISVLFLMVGGYRYVMAHGNEEQAEAAKKTIQHAIMGMVIVIFSFAIVTLLANLLINKTV